MKDKTTAQNKFRDFFYNKDGTSFQKTFTVFRDDANWNDKNVISDQYKNNSLRNTSHGLFGNAFPSHLKDVFLLPLPRKSPQYIDKSVQQILFSIYRHRIELDDFLKLKIEYERNLLDDNFETAKKVIETIITKFGYSYWALEQLSLLCSLFFKNDDELEEMFNETKIKKGFIRIQMANYLEGKFNDDISLFSLVSEFKTTEKRNVKKSGENGKIAVFGVLKLLMFPGFELNSRDEASKGLWLSEGLSLIDRFLILEKCIDYFRLNQIKIKIDFPERVILELKSDRIKDVFLYFSSTSLPHFIDISRDSNKIFEIILTKNLKQSKKVFNEISLNIHSFFEKSLGGRVENEPLLASIYKFNNLDIFRSISDIYFISQQFGLWDLFDAERCSYFNYKESASIKLFYTNFINETSNIKVSEIIEFDKTKGLDTDLEIIEFFKYKKCFNDLITEKNYEEVLVLLHGIYFNNKFLLEFFPLDNFLDGVKTRKEHKELSEEIVPLLAHFVELKNPKGISYNRIYRFLDDYLNSKKYSVPSELVEANEMDEHVLNEFLEFVCVPNVIDSLRSIGTLQKVTEERLKILLYLIDEYNKISRQNDLIKNEFNELLKEVTLSKEITEVAQGRLYIDKDQISMLMIDEIDRDAKTYSTLKNDYIDGVISKLLDDANFNFTDVEDRVKVETKDQPEVISEKIPLRYYVYQKIYDKLKSQYVYHPYFGLDSSLCVRIRHGQFKTYTRKLFSRHHLISTGGDNQYDPDNVYLDKMLKSKGISNKSIDSIMELLKDFSREMGTYIDYVKNNILHIKAPDHSKGLFNFALIDGDLKFSQRSLDELSKVDGDILLESLYSILDSQLEASLTEVKAFFKKEFKDEILQRIDKLHRDIKFINSDIDLSSNILKCRTEVNGHIDTICAWLNMTTDETFENFDLFTLINICKNSSEEVIDGLGFKITKEVTGIPKLLPGKFKRPIIDVINNIFMNVVNHSGQELLNCEIDFIINYLEDGIIFTVTNPVLKEKEEGLSRMSEIRARLTHKDVSSHMRIEGRTGLIKTISILNQYVSQHCKMEFNLNGEKFCLKLELKGLGL